MTFFIPVNLCKGCGNIKVLWHGNCYLPEHILDPLIGNALTKYIDTLDELGRGDEFNFSEVTNNPLYGSDGRVKVDIKVTRIF